MRYAIITSTRSSLAQIEAFLPSNYSAHQADAESAIFVIGQDVAGWTLDGYVQPRLASGLHRAEEITAEEYAEESAWAVADAEQGEVCP